jgi:hypothetical protein
VIHHTDCGMLLFTDHHQVAGQQSEDASVDATGWRTGLAWFPEGRYIRW